MTNAPRKFDRRSFLMTMAAAPAFMAAGQALAADSETAALHELYEAAIQEGGRLIVYAGGDTPQQQDDVKSSFSAQFPKIAITSVVDYSKFHDVRIDNQFATGTVIPDVVHLQTLQDFTRWKDDGRLEAFKPEGFEQIHDSFKDREGAWVGIEVLAFSFMYSAAAAADKQPKNPRDLASIDWKGKMPPPTHTTTMPYCFSISGTWSLMAGTGSPKWQNRTSSSLVARIRPSWR
jgi:hypothetical protein